MNQPHRLRICMLSAAHPATDKRIFDKEARSLSEAGYAVTHLCRGEAEGVEERDGIAIHTYRRQKGKWRRLWFLPRLRKLARGLDADVYHCNEPDSWLVGLSLTLFSSKRVVFDCHEHYAGQVKRWLPRGARTLGAFLYRLYQGLLAQFTDAVILAKFSLARDFAFSARRCHLVLNTTSLRYLPAVRHAGAPEPARFRDSPFVFVHLGVMRRERGSRVLLEAMRHLADLCETETAAVDDGEGGQRAMAPFRVRLIGRIADEPLEAFLAEAQRKGVADLLEVHEWLPFEQAFQWVRTAHCGLILFQSHLGRRKLENNILGMPHKMFDYMLAGLPFIAPRFSPDVRRVARDSEAGLLLDTNDARAVARGMKRLMDDAELCARMGFAGQEAVFARYHWEHDAKVLLRLYREFEERARRRGGGADPPH
ncbi:glycosyltransferase family 4 protein [Sulfidibacter corallicola]|uniref:Glycosyltransferase family 4 protein n=1 Tax=Sulfidibacter corallicola TaxID=2818388 RepID=A0A8A4TMH5_SULCO|nr:glycosyltransferase family 4 protein [Sulfidibacter corallicola]QTD50091.1 glycosyltransferase family 4 protein [Sulfidibacter corallicola]